MKSNPAKRERKPRERSLAETERLLYDFAHAAVVLGTSTATIRRLVAAGLFKPIRLNPRSPVAKQYLRAADVRAYALAQAGGDNAQP